MLRVKEVSREGLTVQIAKLTYEEVLRAARQLPPVQRTALMQALECRPSREEIQKVARRLRPKFRLDATKRRRMDRLVEKRSEGTLTAKEKAELNYLVDEVDENTLRMAKAIDDWVKSTTEERRTANGMAKS
jgi:hypothetical protein